MRRHRAELVVGRPKPRLGPSRAAALAAALLLPLAGAFVQGDSLDDYVRARMREMHIPGLAVALVHDGRVAALRAYGVADLESNSPVTERTLFEIGSLSKQFTAFLVMGLVEERKIGLDDSLSDYLADVPESWKVVTVRQLLSQSSASKTISRWRACSKRPPARGRPTNKSPDFFSTGWLWSSGLGRLGPTATQDSCCLETSLKR